MELKDMVEKQLKESGFDGLFRDESCACKLDDLMPCDEPCIDCKGGFIIPDDHDDRDMDYSFQIGDK